MLVLLAGMACTGRDNFAAIDAQFRGSFPIGMTVDQALSRLDSLKIGGAGCSDSSAIGTIVRGVAKDLRIRTDATHRALV